MLVASCSRCSRRQLLDHTRPAHRALLASRRLSTPNLGKRKGGDEPRDKWNYNAPIFDTVSSDDGSSYELVDATMLAQGKEPPRRVRMLVRDFIEDALYNPQYGYFTKQAVIFDTSDTSFDFAKFRSSVEFQEAVSCRYANYGRDKPDGPGRQLWHTPTEVFKPWYGRAVARCLVSEYLLKYFPYEDFIIYEVGAGNGTLALNILDFLLEVYPEVYDRTRYNVIEISRNLVNLQKTKLSSRHPCAKVFHKSVFQWEQREPAPCFFLAMEVIDNFAHDVIRYDLRTMMPYQAQVIVKDDGDFDVKYASIKDPLIAEFLDIRKKLGHPPPVNRFFRASPLLRRIYTSLPFAPNLSVEEYIPTRLLSLLRILRSQFPRHRLLLSDFSSLPDSIPGVNAPVVQTRFRNMTVPCSTFLTRQGYFDIFFPTNFERLRDIYEYKWSQPSSMDSSGPVGGARATPLMSTTTPYSLGANFFTSYQPSSRRPPVDGVASASGLPVGEHKSNVFTHSEFLRTYADLSKTRVRNGENPMLDFYKNAKFLF